MKITYVAYHIHAVHAINLIWSGSLQPYSLDKPAHLSTMPTIKLSRCPIYHCLPHVRAVLSNGLTLNRPLAVSLCADHRQLYRLVHPEHGAQTSQSLPILTGRHYAPLVYRYSFDSDKDLNRIGYKFLLHNSLSAICLKWNLKYFQVVMRRTKYGSYKRLRNR